MEGDGKEDGKEAAAVKRGRGFNISLQVNPVFLSSPPHDTGAGINDDKWILFKHKFIISSYLFKTSNLRPRCGCTSPRFLFPLLLLRTLSRSLPTQHHQSRSNPARDTVASSMSDCGEGNSG